VIGSLRIDLDRLLARLGALAEVGAIAGGGVSRLALTDADKAGRDLVVSWMEGLGLAVTIDRIGNILATRAGTENTASATF
jgi:N-carbamoyl-L-amino-acid hydrolase